MKKITKLLLSILPILSIVSLSVISCSTTNGADKKPDNRVNNEPKKDPENPRSDRKPEDNHSSKPDGAPKEPENKNPDKPEKDSDKTPKKPDSPGHKEEKEPFKPKPEEKPQKDEPGKSEDIFSDLDGIKKEISFKTIPFYTQRDSRTALVDLQKDPSIIDTIFSKDYKVIYEKYYIQFLTNSGEMPNIQKGLIEKVKLKFTNKKVGKSKTLDFTFIGFKPLDTTNNKKNNKENYLKQRDKVVELSGLFPSLVAYMLLYSQNPNEYKNLMETNNAINFEELVNGNSNLFVDPNLILNAAAIKSLLFEYDNELGKLYKEEIARVSYDDYNGILGVDVKIENREYNDKTNNEPSINKKFTFTGFRKVNVDEPNKSVFSIFLPQNKFRELLAKPPLKTRTQDIKKKNELNKKLLIDNRISEYLKQQIFNNLLVGINDNELKVYNSSSTLSLHTNKDYSSILGLIGNMSIYPFHTILTKDSIKEMYLLVTKDQEKYMAEIEFEFHIPIFASYNTDLKSHITSGENKTLVLKVSTNASID
ncbi:LppA family lipoprotein [Mycoplasma feriruminatoris]|uniref:Immunodominant protein P72 n=1 Tax=Mycoplasma feriruminatoris TaxID=1179777 RepID=A0AAQ3DRM6_9MOLU|nr:LppA family lipoprotein [Mycoplasma feriruminatoris]WFQ94789.1 immunodominant protein P72 [Mycoplasma feriruminatoris]